MVGSSGDRAGLDPETIVDGDTVARPHDGMPVAETSVTETPVTGTPATETPATESPAAGTFLAEAPETYQPGTYVPVAYEPVPYEPYVPAAYEPVDEAPLAPPSSEETPLVEISNGTGRLRMALRVGEFLEDKGIDVGLLTNAEHYRHKRTTVYYRDSWLEQARWISAALPIGAKLEAAPGQTADIRIRLGGDLLNFDRELIYADKKPSNDASG